MVSKRCRSSTALAAKVLSGRMVGGQNAPIQAGGREVGGPGGLGNVRERGFVGLKDRAGECKASGLGRVAEVKSAQDEYIWEESVHSVQNVN
jgi:hypothetical protein